MYLADDLFHSIKQLRPTLFAAPPVFWNRIYSEFNRRYAKAKSELKSKNEEIDEQLLYRKTITTMNLTLGANRLTLDLLV